MTNFKQEVSQRLLNVPNETKMLNAAKIFMQEPAS